jgi:hypothetical protein
MGYLPFLWSGYRKDRVVRPDAQHPISEATRRSLARQAGSCRESVACLCRILRSSADSRRRRRARRESTIGAVADTDIFTAQVPDGDFVLF